MAQLYGEILNFHGLAPIEPAADVLGDRERISGLCIGDIVDLRIKAVPSPSATPATPPGPTDFEAWFTSLHHPTHALLGESLSWELLADEPKNKRDRRTRIKLGGLATFPAFDSAHTVSIDVMSMMLHAPQSWQKEENTAVIVDIPGY